ncbi:hypothetical protein [Collimonas antrihumi]|uniref:hypothetical protein n=1 Tax=Collimonas antrihumi TaxID=1940615 RepID=UPI001B8DA2CD|nr:hypothetical protein [Collimonas antrihumi]
MFNKKNAILSAAVTLAISTLTACGGGGGDGAAVPPAPVAAATASGKVVDGYLSSAQVLCDTNNNGVADAGEVVVITNGQGDFAFSPACSSPVVASGGTNIDTGLPFKGVIKASAGSTVVTPLTTLLVNTGLTAAQLAAALGLPAGTDVTKIDPAAKNAAGALVNADLQKKTLAVQQVMQQIANTIGTLAQNTSTSAIQAIYGEVVQAVVKTLSANTTATLVDATGNVNVSLVNGIVQQSLTNVAASAATALTVTKQNIGTYSPKSVAALTAAGIASGAQTLAQSTDSNALTKSLHADTTIGDAANQIAALLTTANAGKVDLTAAGTSLQQFIAASIAGDAAGKSAAGTKLKADVATQSTNSGTPVTLDTSTLNTPSNYLSIQNDQIALNGTTYTLSQFTSGLTVTGATQASLDTVGFTFVVHGTPIPVNASGVKATTVGMALELTDTGASGRVLQMSIDTVNIAVDASNQVSASVPAGAKVYIYGKTASGVTANLTLNNVAANSISVGPSNAVNFNMGILFNRLLAGIQAQPGNQSTVFTNLQNLKGTFNVKFVMSNLDLRKQDTTPATGLSVLVTAANQPPVSGLGVQGIVTVK